MSSKLDLSKKLVLKRAMSKCPTYLYGALGQGIPQKGLLLTRREGGVFQFCSMLFAAASSLFAVVQRHIFEVTRMDLRAKIIVFALVAPGGESLLRKRQCQRGPNNRSGCCWLCRSHTKWHFLSLFTQFHRKKNSKRVANTVHQQVVVWRMMIMVPYTTLKRAWKPFWS